MAYCTHILTDVIWTDTVWRDYISKVIGVCPKSELKALYYRETDYIDFKMYREAAWRDDIWKRYLEKIDKK